MVVQLSYQDEQESYLDQLIQLLGSVVELIVKQV